MAQDLFRVELGLADDNVHYLSGAGAPAGTLADAAPIGSEWSNTTTGTKYTRSSTGWVALATGGDASALLDEVNDIETSVGLETDGTLVWSGTPENFLAGDSVTAAVSKIDLALTVTEGVATGAASLAALKVAKAGDTMTGNLAFGGTNTVTGLIAPTDGTDAATKNYVDNLVTGLSWLPPVDTVGATNPLTATSGERFLNTTDGKIYTATATDTWNAGVLGLDGQAVFEREFDAAYTYTGTAWVQFTGAGQIDAGVGLAKAGNQLNINLGAGVSQLPSDEVGVDVRPDSGLFLTVDGTAASTDTAAQLAIKLDGATLSMGANGLRLSSTQTSAISDNTSAIGTATTLLAKARAETSVLASTSAAMGGVLVDTFETAKWIVTVRGTGADVAKKTVAEVLAIHDGTASADATQVDYTVYAKLKLDVIDGLAFSVSLTGTGAAQTMSLTVSATNAVDVSAVREVAGF